MSFAGIGEDSQGLFPQFKTPDGVVPLNVLSQGTQSLIQWCAQLVFGYAEYFGFPADLSNKPGVLMVDEIDAHLHPSWQRRILPALTTYFPGLQVFCAAHSPLTIAGLKAGQVQLLTRDRESKVHVSRNQSDIVGWSADEIYSGFFDVEPTDAATEEKLERVRQLREKSILKASEKRELTSLRKEVHWSLTNTPLFELNASRLKAKGKRGPRKQSLASRQTGLKAPQQRSGRRDGTPLKKKQRTS
jgi:predicted ATP-binding protein involved in virulence